MTATTPLPPVASLLRLRVGARPGGFGRGWALRLVGAMLVGWLTAQVAVAQSFEYDEAKRLVRVSYADGSSVVYRYDKNGNREAEVTAAAASRVALAGGSGAFGSVKLGDTVPVRSLVLRNEGSQLMTLTGFTGLSAPFSASGFEGCRAIDTGGTCTVQLSMASTATGSWTQTARTVGATEAAEVAVSGAVTAVSSVLTLMTAGNPVNLGNSLTPSSGSGRALTYRNTGNAPLTLSGAPVLSGSGLALGATSCTAGKVLAANDECTVFVGVTGAAGSYSGSLTVNSSANAVTRSLAATSTGQLSGSGANFGDVVSGQTASRSYTVTNTAAFAVRGLSVSVSAPYSVTTNGCTGAVLAANASCSLTVRFAPTAAGSFSGDAYLSVRGSYNQVVTSPDGNSAAESGTAGAAVDYKMGLTGTGVAAAPVLSVVTPGNPVNLGTTHTPAAASGRSLWLSNTGNAPLTIQAAPVVTGSNLGVWVGSPGNCAAGKVLAPAERCSMSVYANGPQASLSGAVTVNSSVGTVTVPVQITTRGRLDSAGATFDDVPVNSTMDKVVRVNNTAAYPMRSVSVSAQVPYSVVSDGCSNATIAASGFCELTVRFSPTAVGLTSGGGYLRVSGRYSQTWLADDGTTMAEGTQAGSSVDYPVDLTGRAVAGPAVTVTMSKVTALAGEAVSFGWDASNASRVEASCDSGAAPYSGPLLRSSLSVALSTGGQVRCIATAFNAAGQSASASQTLTFLMPSVTTAMSATTVSLAGSASFSWDASNASRVVANCDNGGASYDGSALKSSIAVSTSAAGAVRCTAVAYGGVSAGTTVSVSSSQSLTVVNPLKLFSVEDPVRTEYPSSVLASITIRNPAGIAAQVTGLRVTGTADPGDVFLNAGGCGVGASVNAGATCTVTVEVQKVCAFNNTTNVGGRFFGVEIENGAGSSASRTVVVPGLTAECLNVLPPGGDRRRPSPNPSPPQPQPTGSGGGEAR